MSALDAGVRELLARAGQRIAERFGDDDNVTGVGVGFRRRGGRLTDEPVVTVMVRRKRRPSLVSRRRMIPAAVEVDGTSCATDVIQAQAILLHADGTPPAVPPIKFPTLKFGVGISNLSDARPDAGTLGAFVRDNTDGTTNILSANHVIADDNTAPIGDPILHPASLDDPNTGRNAVARLKRFVPIVGGATAVDAAIAEVGPGIAVDAGHNGYDNVAAPTTTRPAVGMVVAGDGFGNVWLTRMSTTLTALNATLLPDRANANVEATAPAIDAQLEKIGRTSGYTTGRVFATGQTLDVTVPGQGVVRYTDLILTQWMGWAGDSGAMVIRKGDAAARDDDAWDALSRANLMRLIGDVFGPCEILSTLEYAYGIPATDDEALADSVRDEYLSQSHVGRFLITLTYLNTALVRSRLANVQSPTYQAYVQALYDEYQPVITELMANPRSTRVITQQDGETYQNLLNALQQSGVLTASERRVAYELSNTHQAMQGMNRTQVLAYMNTMYALRSLRNAVIAMPAVQMVGAARALSDVD